MGETMRGLGAGALRILGAIAMTVTLALAVLAGAAPTALAAEAGTEGRVAMASGVDAAAPSDSTADATPVATAEMDDDEADSPRADAADQEIYAIFYKNPDGQSYTLVIQNGDTLDPAYPKPADDQVVLVCTGDDEKCGCAFLSFSTQAYREYTTCVEVRPGVMPHTTNNWFKGFKSLEALDLAGLDTSKTTSMVSMFEGCSSLKLVSLPETFGAEKVTDMSSMFSRCSSLKTLVFSEKFNPSQVVGMRAMFWNCTSLESIDLSKFNTVSVTDMEGMFSGCSALKSLDLGKFDTSGVVNMSGMFSGCKSLGTLDLSNFDTSKITNMSDMFSDCWSLKTLSFSDRFATSWVTDMNSMFRGCSSLQFLDLSGFDMARVKHFDNMLVQCISLDKISLPATGDFAKAGLPVWRNSRSVKWRNEKGEVFAADAIPARTAGTYTAVVEGSGSGDESGGDGSGSGDGNGGDGGNSGSGNGNGNNGSNNNGSGNGSGSGPGSGPGSADPAPNRTVALSEAVVLPLDATGVAMGKDDVIRDLAKRFGSREGFPADATSVAVTIRLGGEEVEAIDPRRAGTYEVTAVYSMPDGTERVIEAAYTVADPAAKAAAKAPAGPTTRLAQTGDEAPAVPLATAALAACALAAAVAARRRACR